jgi:hypothetical protein
VVVTLPPGKRSGTRFTEGLVCPEAGLNGKGKLVHIGIRTPDGAARSQSLYRPPIHIMGTASFSEKNWRGRGADRAHHLPLRLKSNSYTSIPALYLHGILQGKLCLWLVKFVSAVLIKKHYVSERLSTCNPDETSNCITYRIGSADAIQTKPLSNNTTYSNGSADAIQTKLYLCSLSERLTRCNQH